MPLSSLQPLPLQHFRGLPQIYVLQQPENSAFPQYFSYFSTLALMESCARLRFSMQHFKWICCCGILYPACLLPKLLPHIDCRWFRIDPPTHQSVICSLLLHSCTLTLFIRQNPSCAISFMFFFFYITLSIVSRVSLLLIFAFIAKQSGIFECFSYSFYALPSTCICMYNTYSYMLFGRCALVRISS